MNMKTITWKGDERMIPGYGMARIGEDVAVPPEMADSFIKQGLADEKKKSSSKKFDAIKEG